jgi:GntR family transcriptional regulator, transcriptional repressor for pyruvate dehydrogenase complex
VTRARATRGRPRRERRSAIELEPVRPLALKERVIRQLTQLIDDDVLKPGDQLPSERELSDELRVSRGTVREAVQFLQALGLLEIRHGSGTFVRLAADRSALRDEWREWTIRHAERIHDLLEIRKALEPFAAELAAKRAREGELASMEEALAEMQPAVDSPDVTALIQADLAFHHALCAAAGNAALSEFADALGEQLVRERGTIWNLPGRPARSLVEHRAIFDAVRAGDKRRARKAVLDHLDSVEKDLGASVLRRPETKG